MSASSAAKATSAMALKGIKVIELAGLAPAPFCGLILSDFGANVVRIDKLGGQPFGEDTLDRGKRSIALDIKSAEGAAVLRRLCRDADVLIEPFRHGVMEKLGLGPDVLTADNPRLIYSRLTGFGQEGPLAKAAGHDINYVAISGVLSRLKRKGQNPFPPINLLADFAGGGMMCAMGICMALIERHASGKGQVIDSNMVDGVSYIGTWLWKTKDQFFGGPPGENMLDSGAPYYDTYRTKDDKYMAVGALEPQFYDQFIKGLGLTDQDVPDRFDYDNNRALFADTFARKTREEWTAIFEGISDACVTPVLDMEEAPLYRHNKERRSFVNPNGGEMVPRPAPHLVRTPGLVSTDKPTVGQHTRQVLSEAGFEPSEIERLEKANVVKSNL